MRIVMLGWEFPPFIAGGLGVACHGLTKALDRRGHEILFVLPRPVDRSHASHVKLFSPEGRPIVQGVVGPSGQPIWGVGSVLEEAGLPKDAKFGVGHTAGFGHTTFVGVSAGFRSPYRSGGAAVAAKRRGRGAPRAAGDPATDDLIDELVDEMLDFPEQQHAAAEHGGGATFGTTGAGKGYQGDLFAEAERYARLVVALLRHEKFDLIHAHDWLTFPAGQALARVTGKPLLVHVHSTEFDRSGENVNQRVYDIERRGMHSAMRVLCVSDYTKSIVTSRYAMDTSQVDVVYNGIDAEGLQPRPGMEISRKDKIVLFLGRITMQKGPEYFIAAAKRVLEKVPEAKFIMAGSGDMELRMIELAAQLGIGHRVLFTGFLRGGDVNRVLAMADCYVMPSVSEPFGIAPLEAMRADVPTIISKTSGVSEVLTHTLKVDFWDIDEMANKIVAVLRHPPLGQTLREHGSVELRRLTWDQSAQQCEEAYRRAVLGTRELVRS